MPVTRSLPLLTILLALSGCAAYSCQTGPCSPDEKLVEAVKTNIARHPALLSDHVRVRSDGGTVYLYGLVSTNVELVDVADIAKATPGVKEVVNLCAIEDPQR